MATRIKASDLFDQSQSQSGWLDFDEELSPQQTGAAAYRQTTASAGAGLPTAQNNGPRGGVDTLNNTGVFDTMKDAADSSMYNMLSGSASFIAHTFESETAADLAKKWKQSALDNTEDMSKIDEGSARWWGHAIGTGAGSMAPSLAIGAVMSGIAAVAGPGAAAAVGAGRLAALAPRGIGMLASLASKYPKAMALGKALGSAIPKTTIGKVVAAQQFGDIIEAASEAGSTVESMKEQNAKGIAHYSDSDISRAKWGNFATNALLLGGSDYLGGKYFKYVDKAMGGNGFLGKAVTSSELPDYIRNAARAKATTIGLKALAMMPANAVKEGGEEYAQNYSQSYWSNEKFDQEQAKKEALIGGASGLFFGGLFGGGINLWDAHRGNAPVNFSLKDKDTGESKDYEMQRGVGYKINGEDVTAKEYYDDLRKNSDGAVDINSTNPYAENSDLFFGLGRDELQKYSKAALGLEAANLPENERQETDNLLYDNQHKTLDEIEEIKKRYKDIETNRPDDLDKRSLDEINTTRYDRKRERNKARKEEIDKAMVDFERQMANLREAENMSAEVDKFGAAYDNLPQDLRDTYFEQAKNFILNGEAGVNDSSKEEVKKLLDSNTDETRKRHVVSAIAKANGLGLSDAIERAKATEANTAAQTQSTETNTTTQNQPSEQTTPSVNKQIDVTEEVEDSAEANAPTVAKNTQTTKPVVSVRHQEVPSTKLNQQNYVVNDNGKQIKVAKFKLANGKYSVRATSDTATNAKELGHNVTKVPVFNSENEANEYINNLSESNITEPAGHQIQAIKDKAERERVAAEKAKQKEAEKNRPKASKKTIGMRTAMVKDQKGKNPDIGSLKFKGMSDDGKFTATYASDKATATITPTDNGYSINISENGTNKSFVANGTFANAKKAITDILEDGSNVSASLVEEDNKENTTTESPSGQKEAEEKDTKSESSEDKKLSPEEEFENTTPKLQHNSLLDDIEAFERNEFNDLGRRVGGTRSAEARTDIETIDEHYGKFTRAEESNMDSMTAAGEHITHGQLKQWYSNMIKVVEAAAKALGEKGIKVRVETNPTNVVKLFESEGYKAEYNPADGTYLVTTPDGVTNKWAGGMFRANKGEESVIILPQESKAADVPAHEYTHLFWQLCLTKAQREKIAELMRGTRIYKDMLANKALREHYSKTPLGLEEEAYCRLVGKLSTEMETNSNLQHDLDGVPHSRFMRFVHSLINGIRKLFGMPPLNSTNRTEIRDALAAPIRELLKAKDSIAQKFDNSSSENEKGPSLETEAAEQDFFNAGTELTEQEAQEVYQNPEASLVFDSDKKEGFAGKNLNEIPAEQQARALATYRETVWRLLTRLCGLDEALKMTGTERKKYASRILNGAVAKNIISDDEAKSLISLVQLYTTTESVNYAANRRAAAQEAIRNMIVDFFENYGVSEDGANIANETQKVFALYTARELGISDARGLYNELMTASYRKKNQAKTNIKILLDTAVDANVIGNETASKILDSWDISNVEDWQDAITAQFNNIASGSEFFSKDQVSLTDVVPQEIARLFDSSKQHQAKAVVAMNNRWKDHDMFAILSGPGAGKTYISVGQIANTFINHKEEHENDANEQTPATLVLCGTRATKRAWLRAIQRMNERLKDIKGAPQITAIDATGATIPTSAKRGDQKLSHNDTVGNNRYCVYIATYSMMQGNNAIKDNNWQYIYSDEVHSIRSVASGNRSDTLEAYEKLRKSCIGRNGKICEISATFTPYLENIKSNLGPYITDKALSKEEKEKAYEKFFSDVIDKYLSIMDEEFSLMDGGFYVRDKKGSIIKRSRKWTPGETFTHYGDGIEHSGPIFKFLREIGLMKPVKTAEDLMDFINGKDKCIVNEKFLDYLTSAGVQQRLRGTILALSNRLRDINVNAVKASRTMRQKSVLVNFCNRMKYKSDAKIMDEYFAILDSLSQDNDRGLFEQKNGDSNLASIYKLITIDAYNEVVSEVKKAVKSGKAKRFASGNTIVSITMTDNDSLVKGKKFELITIGPKGEIIESSKGEILQACAASINTKYLRRIGKYALENFDDIESNQKLFDDVKAVAEGKNGFAYSNNTLATVAEDKAIETEQNYLSREKEIQEMREESGANVFLTDEEKKTADTTSESENFSKIYDAFNKYFKTPTQRRLALGRLESVLEAIKKEKGTINAIKAITKKSSQKSVEQRLNEAISAVKMSARRAAAVQEVLRDRGAIHSTSTSSFMGKQRTTVHITDRVLMMDTSLAALEDEVGKEFASRKSVQERLQQSRECARRAAICSNGIKGLFKALQTIKESLDDNVKADKSITKTELYKTINSILDADSKAATGSPATTIRHILELAKVQASCAEIIRQKIVETAINEKRKEKYNSLGTTTTSDKQTLKAEFIPVKSRFVIACSYSKTFEDNFVSQLKKIAAENNGVVSREINKWLNENPLFVEQISEWVNSKATCNSEAAKMLNQPVAHLQDEETVEEKNPLTGEITISVKSGLTKNEGIEKFQNGDSDVLVCTVDSVSEGTDLDEIFTPAKIDELGEPYKVPMSLEEAGGVLTASQQKDIEFMTAMSEWNRRRVHRNSPVTMFVAIIPKSPQQLIQLEERIRRANTMNDAGMRYLTFGTEIEKASFYKQNMLGILTDALAHGTDYSAEGWDRVVSYAHATSFPAGFGFRAGEKYKFENPKATAFERRKPMDLLDYSPEVDIAQMTVSMVATNDKRADNFRASLISPTAEERKARLERMAKTRKMFAKYQQLIKTDSAAAIDGIIEDVLENIEYSVPKKWVSVLSKLTKEQKQIMQCVLDYDLEIYAADTIGPRNFFALVDIYMNLSAKDKSHIINRAMAEIIQGLRNASILDVKYVLRTEALDKLSDALVDKTTTLECQALQRHIVSNPKVNFKLELHKTTRNPVGVYRIKALNGDTKSVYYKWTQLSQADAQSTAALLSKLGKDQNITFESSLNGAVETDAIASKTPLTKEQTMSRRLRGAMANEAIGPQFFSVEQQLVAKMFAKNEDSFDSGTIFDYYNNEIEAIKERFDEMLNADNGKGLVQHISDYVRFVAVANRLRLEHNEMNKERKKQGLRPLDFDKTKLNLPPLPSEKTLAEMDELCSALAEDMTDMLQLGDDEVSEAILDVITTDIEARSGLTLEYEMADALSFDDINDVAGDALDSLAISVLEDAETIAKATGLSVDEVFGSQAKFSNGETSTSDTVHKVYASIVEASRNELKDCVKTQQNEESSWQNIMEFIKNPMEFTKESRGELYLYLVDKNDPLHKIDSYMRKYLGEKFGNLIYETTQASSGTAAGMANTLSDGTAKQVERMNLFLALTGTENELSKTGTMREVMTRLKTLAVKASNNPNSREAAFFKKYSNDNPIEAAEYYFACKILHARYLQHQLDQQTERTQAVIAGKSFTATPFKWPGTLNLQKCRSVLRDAGWKFDEVQVGDTVELKVNAHIETAMIDREDGTSYPVKKIVVDGREDDIFNAVGEAYRELNNNLLKMLHSSQIISSTSKQHMMTVNPDYAPLNRDLTDDAGYDNFIKSVSNGGSGMAGVRSPIRRINKSGSAAPVIAPLETTLKATAVYCNRCARNRTALIAIGSMREVNNLRLHLAQEKINNAKSLEEAKAATNELEDLQNEIKDLTFVPIKEYTTMVRGKDGKMHRGFPTAHRGNGVFTVMKHGKVCEYQTTKEFYDPIVGYEPFVMKSVLKLAQDLATTLRTGATLQPSFILRNFFRDTVFAGVSSENGFIPIRDSIRGWKALKDEAFWAEYQSLGIGAFNFYGDLAEASKNLDEIMALRKKGLAKTVDEYKDFFKYIVKADLKNAGKAAGRGNKALATETFESIKYLSDIVESSTRAGEYILAKENKTKQLKQENSKLSDESKLSEEQIERIAMRYAATQARNITLDFSRNGIYGRNYNKITPFFNAAIQGTDKVRQLINRDGLGKFLTKVGMYIVFPTIALYAVQMAYSPEDRFTVNASMRYSYWMLPLGHGKYLRLPKPQELGVFFGSTLEAALDALWLHDKSAMTDWAHEMVNVLLPTLVPTIVSPLLEWQTNYNFLTQRPVVTNRLKDLKPHLQYTPTTSMTSRNLAKLFKDTKLEKTPLGSPLFIDNTVRGYRGTGGYLLWNALGLLDPRTWQKNVAYWYEFYPFRDVVVSENNHTEDITRYYAFTSQLNTLSKSGEPNSEEAKKKLDTIHRYKFKVGRAELTMTQASRELALLYDKEGGYADWSKEKRRAKIAELTEGMRKTARKVLIDYKDDAEYFVPPYEGILHDLFDGGAKTTSDLIKIATPKTSTRKKNTKYKEETSSLIDR